MSETKKSLTNTGLYLNAKLKQMFEKDAVSKNGQPYKRRSMRVVFLPKGQDEEETRSVYVSVPPGFQLPAFLTEGGVYTFPVDVQGGNERAVYFSLNTHVPIQADE